MVLEDIPAFYRGTSPNKFFDYLACGLPVVNNYPGWLADLIRDHQLGIAVSRRSRSFCISIDSSGLTTRFGHVMA